MFSGCVFVFGMGIESARCMAKAMGLVERRYGVVFGLCCCNVFWCMVVVFCHDILVSLFVFFFG